MSQSGVASHDAAERLVRRAPLLQQAGDVTHAARPLDEVHAVESGERRGVQSVVAEAAQVGEEPATPAHGGGALGEARRGVWCVRWACALVRSSPVDAHVAHVDGAGQVEAAEPEAERDVLIGVVRHGGAVDEGTHLRRAREQRDERSAAPPTSTKSTGVSRSLLARGSLTPSQPTRGEPRLGPRANGATHAAPSALRCPVRPSPRSSRAALYSSRCSIGSASSANRETVASWKPFFTPFLRRAASVCSSVYSSSGSCQYRPISPVVDLPMQWGGEPCEKEQGEGEG